MPEVDSRTYAHAPPTRPYPPVAGQSVNRKRTVWYRGTGALITTELTAPPVFVLIEIIHHATMQLRSVRLSFDLRQNPAKG